MGVESLDGRKDTVTGFGDHTLPHHQAPSLTRSTTAARSNLLASAFRILGARSLIAFSVFNRSKLISRYVKHTIALPALVDLALDYSLSFI